MVINKKDKFYKTRRSREGAWIEISKRLLILLICFGRSREGAWIEIRRNFRNHAVPRRRSREGAWIEIDVSR